jgi:hypothetical protein
MTVAWTNINSAFNNFVIENFRMNGIVLILLWKSYWLRFSLSRHKGNKSPQPSRRNWKFIFKILSVKYCSTAINYYTVKNLDRNKLSNPK